MTTVAVMQPYFFPYLGYFNLLHACDIFVFLDNVQHIARGFVNRNRILVAGEPRSFTVPLAAAPRTHWINQRRTADNYPLFQKKFMTMLGHAYAKAPQFAQTMTLVAEVLDSGETNLARLCRASVLAVCRHLGLERRTLMASELLCEPEARALKGKDKIIRLAALAGGTRYVNPMGGTTLYAEEDFSSAGLELRFVKPLLPPYPQPLSQPLPGLSIIDVLMYTTKEKAAELLESYAELSRKEAVAGQSS